MGVSGIIAWVMAYLIGLDLGTTSIKSVLLDSHSGEIVASASRPTPVEHPRPEWSEHDPLALWQAAAACLWAVSNHGREIAGIAISSMAETGVALDENRQPIGSMIAWYDRRSEPQAAWIEKTIPAADLFALTGQRVSPSFAITKLLWMRAMRPAEAQRAVAWLPAAAFVLQRLCGSEAVDYTLAARTLLFDQHRLDWSDRLLETFALPRTFLPAVKPGGTLAGSVTAEAARITGLPEGTPCVLGGHDHMCAALASGGYHAGSVVDSTGTAQAVVMLLPQFLPHAALANQGFACSAYLLPGLFALKGGLKAAGSSIEWLARQLTAPGQPPDYARLEQAASQQVGKRAGPVWLPHLIGSGTPQGDRFSRAALVGAQFEHTQGDLFRGLLESLAFWLRHNLEVMADISGLPVQDIQLTGGVTRIELLSQLKADVLGRPVYQPQIPETAAVGAALLAGLGTGVFSSPQAACSALRYPTKTFQPHPERTTWYEMIYHQIYRPLYANLAEVHHRLDAIQQQAQEP